MKYKNKKITDDSELRDLIGDRLCSKLVVSILKSQSEIIRAYNIPTYYGGYVRFYGGTLVWSLLGDHSSDKVIKSFKERKDQELIMRQAIRSLKRGRGLTGLDFHKIKIEVMDDITIHIYSKDGSRFLNEQIVKNNDGRLKTLFIKAKFLWLRFLKKFKY